jgi:Ribbon-helix-helix domain
MIGRQLLMKPKRRSRHREASPDFKRTVHVAGRKTSVSLESAFWQALKTIAALEKNRSTILLRKSTMTGRTPTYHPRSACSCLAIISPRETVAAAHRPGLSDREHPRVTHPVPGREQQ